MHNRRDFLKKFALLGTAVALPIHDLFADSPLTPKKVGDGLSVIRLGKDFKQKVPPRTISIPDVGEFKVLKGDFHMHTLFSDGHVMPKDRVDEAVDNGLDVIAITDHIEYRPNIGSEKLKLAENNDDHNRSYNFAKEEAEKNELLLVRGTEITKKMWHFNALFVNDVNPIAAAVDDWKAMLAVAVDQGGFIHWNHPNWIDRDSETPPFGLKEGEPLRFFDEIEEARVKGHVHGVEVFNGVSFCPIALDWCNDRDLAPIAVTDIHESDWNKYGHQNPLRPMTLIFAKDRSLESVREAFFAKRTVGWAANMILGRHTWVEKLFRSSVEIKKNDAGLTLHNLSDIPCLIETNGKSSELLAKETLTIDSSNKITVRNWFIGMKKPLEITVQ